MDRDRPPINVPPCCLWMKNTAANTARKLSASPRASQRSGAISSSEIAGPFDEESSELLHARQAPVTGFE